MFSRWPNAALAALLLLGGCAPSAPKAPDTAQAELGDVAPIVATYKADGVMGSDVPAKTPQTLQISFDAEKWSTLDDERESQIRSSFASAWAKTWSKHHRGAHAVVRVRFIDYYGGELAADSKRV